MGDPESADRPNPTSSEEDLANQIRALLGRGLEGQVHAADEKAAPLVAAINELVTAARTAEIRVRAIARDRDELDAAMADLEGRLAHEITEHEQTVRDLRHQRSLLRSVLDAFPYCIFWKDREGVYLGANQNKIRALGLSSVEELIGKTDYDLSSSREDAEFYRTIDKRVMDTGEPILNLKESQQRPDGRHVLLTTKVPLRDDSGVVTGILGMYVDVTASRMNESEE